MAEKLTMLPILRNQVDCKEKLLLLLPSLKNAWHGLTLYFSHSYETEKSSCKQA